MAKSASTAAAGPAKRKKKAAAPPAPEQPPAVLDADGTITRPFSCAECQRLREEQAGGWLAWKCHHCGLPVWFRTRAERLAYAAQSASYCVRSKSDPCNCASRGGPADDADEVSFD